MPDAVVLTCPDCGSRRPYQLDVSNREDRTQLREEALAHLRSHGHSEVEVRNLLIEVLRTRFETTVTAETLEEADRMGWDGSMPALDGCTSARGSRS